MDAAANSDFTSSSSATQQPSAQNAAANSTWCWEVEVVVRAEQQHRPGCQLRRGPTVLVGGSGGKDACLYSRPPRPMKSSVRHALPRQAPASEIASPFPPPRAAPYASAERRCPRTHLLLPSSADHTHSSTTCSTASPPGYPDQRLRPPIASPPCLVLRRARGSTLSVACRTLKRMPPPPCGACADCPRHASGE